MTKMDFTSFIKNILRRGFYKWPARGEALRNARKERGVYVCESCKGEFSSKDVQVDHHEPVVELDNDPSKPMNWTKYIKRLYCDASNLKILCRPCHKSKTYLETQFRKDFKNNLAFGKMKDGKDGKRKKK